MHIEDTLAKHSSQQASSRPEIFALDGGAKQKGLEQLLASGKIQHVTDDYEEQLEELFQINNPSKVYTPSFKSEFAVWRDKVIKEPGNQARLGNWVYFPWNSTLVHILPDADFQRVRTARNRNLITEEEQKQFYNAVVGIGGLSVGNSVALALVLQGGARRIRLADFDKLALSNLNRIRADVTALGLPKVEMTARQIYALNPYAEVELFADGLTEKNINKFFDGLDVVIDELDTLPIKLRIREEAKKRKIPVVMGADNGDNAVIDIDRYDLTPDLKYFHNRLGDVTVKDLTGLDKFGIGKTITKMIGAENITQRMQGSLLEMGKTIVSWPQLGGAALLNGIAVAYCVRKIVNKQDLELDRALISMDEKLEPDHHAPANKALRDAASKKFASLFGL